LNGVSLFNPRTEVFLEVRTQPGASEFLPGSGVPGVYVDADGTLWLGVLEGGGLIHFDLQRGVLARYTHDPGDPTSLPSNHAQDILRDRDGNLWVGTIGGGLARMRPDGHGFDVFRHDDDDPTSVGSDSIWCLYVDSRDTLWVGTLDSGLSARCRGCTAFIHHRDDPSDAASLGGEVVNAIYEDSRGEFWIGLRPGGLVRLDRASGRAEHFRPAPGRLGTLSNDTVTAIMEDRDGELWIGTQGGGVNRARRQADGSLVFSSYSRRDGLGGDAIGAIVQDRSGKLWLSTIAGLSRIDPASGTIENFGARDGVEGGGYFIGAFATMVDGTIVFGGVRAATVFDPTQVPALADAGTVAITDFRTFRSRVESGEPPFRLERDAGGMRVHMREGVDDFTAEFSSLSYAAPAAVAYAYRLDDYDPEWITTDARRRFASYNNLAPGDYTLRVRARPTGGAWSEETHLPIHLATPWWRTTWARAGYTLLALGVLATFLWQARQRVHDRERAQAELAASEERLKLALWGTGDELWDMDLRTGELFRENPLQHLEYPDVRYVPDSNALRRYLHRDDVAVFDKALLEQVKGLTDFVDVSYRVRDRSGQWRWLRTRGRATRCDQAGRALRLSGTTEDVTEIKEHEHTLERINQDLERRVRERTADLTVANESLRHTIEQLRLTQRQLVDSEKMAALGGLVAGVAHEINTPLGIGVTAASHLDVEVKRLNKLIEREQLKRSDIEHFQRAALDSTQLIMRNLQRADKLVRSFKQVAVDQSSEQRRRINLKAYLGEILTSLHPALKKTRHQVEVEAPEDLELETFPGAIYQIVVNLVMNSLIHGFEGMEGGHIRIALTRAGNEVVMHYSDDGKGMPPDVARRVFEPFFTTRRGQGGSGLGMHIAYNLAVQVLRGSITCDSEPGQGVRFVVRIPV
jgi:signal transduction histidine kinase/streptogramin lyase